MARASVAVGRPRVGPSVVVAVAAVAAVLLRLPGLLAPLGADESGFTLVARAWDPAPESLYGDYWVARPPTLIALVKLSDLVGGPLFVRVLGALGCGVVVLAAAATARQALRYSGSTDEAVARRAGAWVAVLAAALTSHALIDPVSTKGELLGIPFVMTSCWLVLRALVRDRVGRAAVVEAGMAGVAGMLAVGMKQNMGAGLVFGLVVLVGSRVTGRLTTPALVRLVAAGAVGAALPVVVVVGWTVGAGVDLAELWYAVYGFRSESLDVLAGDATGGSAGRALALAGIALATGMGLVVAAVALHVRGVWRRAPVLLVATTAVVVVDVVGIALSGQFWRPYLFVLVPDLVLCAVLLAAGGAAARLSRVLVVAAAVSSLVSVAAWAWLSALGTLSTDEVASGRAVGAAARPGDTIFSYGGAADLVLASGLESPYPYLWSLQMRARDPELARLRDLLAGPRAPTWVVMKAPGYSWNHLGDAIRPVLEERYDVHGRICNGRYLWLLADEERPPLAPHCPPD